MPLQSSGAISMNDMRSQFGISGSISMSSLYRGGSYVDTEQARTDLISSVTDSGYGQAGYTQRFNYGNLNNWSFSTTGNPPQNFYGGRFPFQMGYLYNGQQASSDLQSLNASNGGGSRAGTYGYHLYNGAALTYESGAMFYHVGTNTTSGGNYHVHNITFAVAGTYYVYVGQANGWPYDQYFYYSVSGANSGNVTNKNAYGYTIGNTAGSFGINGTTINVSANQTVTITLNQQAGSISQECSISTKNNQWNSRVAPVNTSVPGSGQISFSQFYGAR